MVIICASLSTPRSRAKDKIRYAKDWLEEVLVKDNCARRAFRLHFQPDKWKRWCGYAEELKVKSDCAWAQRQCW